MGKRQAKTAWPEALISLSTRFNPYAMALSPMAGGGPMRVRRVRYRAEIKMIP
jgi:hypothetical protein